MNTSRVDLLNTFLILLSFGLAYFLPFELFLMAYVILGPLHYFTEINWIRDKKYFVSNKNWVPLVMGFAFLIMVPVILKLSVFEKLTDNSLGNAVKVNLPLYLNSLFFLGIVIAISLTTLREKRHQLLVISVGVILAILMHSFSLYHIVFGIFLPTIIHVYLFTILFMWYGNLKNNNRIGYINVLLMLLIPIFILIMNIDQSLYNFSTTIKSTYVDNRFHVLNVNISKILGFTDGTKFFFYEVLDLKIQIFIAFAYTYHYLNWFSKTTIIGWHKRLTTKKALGISVLWILSIGLYFYNFALGLSIVLFASLLHVFMELPLNVISLRTIFQNYLRKTSQEN